MYEVSVIDVESRPTAVIPAATSWGEFPTLWPTLLGEVWACLNAAGIRSGCRNVMLYRDDVPHVEVGVLLDRPCDLTGRIVMSALPAGRVATTVHHGSYAGLRDAHQAIHDRGLPLAGPRWEIYGPHHDDPAQVWTEIYHLLA